TTVSPEQIRDGKQMLIDMQKALLPAKLKNLHANGYLIVNEVLKRDLPLTVESALKVVKAILFENKLVWDVEPAALRKKAANDAPANETAVQKSHSEREAAARNAEKADA